MFRDPAYFRALREQVVPLLRTYPSLKIWVAGCSTGEEVYSLAILLREEGLLERSLIYATDINPRTLQQAEAGIYAIDRIAGFTDNHRDPARTSSLSDYYTAAYGRRGVRQVACGAHRVLRSQSGHRQRVRGGAAGLLPQRAHLLQSRAAGSGASACFATRCAARVSSGIGSKESLRFSGAGARVRRRSSREERIYQKADVDVNA